MNLESPKPIVYPEKPGEVVPLDYYYNVMNNIFENIGQDSPLYEMAGTLADKFGIPNGPTSALTRNNFDYQNDKEAYDKAKENDRIIGTVFANIPGVYVGMGKNKLNEQAPIVTMDINTILDALNEGQGDIDIKFEQFLSALPERDRNIIEGERELRKKKKEKMSGNEDDYKINRPLIYSRPLGGVGVFLRGYVHKKEWQKNFGTELTDIYAKNSSLVLIEGCSDLPLGKSLKEYWRKVISSDYYHYNVLMRSIAKQNPKILFGEIDGRNASKVSMDNDDDDYNYQNLPIEFYNNYYDYLTKINPNFIKNIEGPKELKKLLRLQSTSYQGVFNRDFSLNNKDTNTRFHSNPSIDTKGQSSSHMTGFELGQLMYSDAFSCVKLHLLAKLSAEGHIPSGPIVDFQGSDHLSGKTFFMQNPQYALMIILMNINQLMAGQAIKLDSNNETAVQYSKDIFLNPNWKDVVNEILKLPIASIEDSSIKGTSPFLSLLQKNLINETPDFAKIYKMNVSEIVEELNNTFNK